MTNKKALFIVLTILILLILPFFLLSFYNHPAADDYGFSTLIKAAGRWKYQDYMYHNWSGRYMAGFIFSFNPLTFDSFTGYRLVAFVMLTAFVISVFYTILVLIRNQFNTVTISIVSLLLVLLYLDIIPSTSETIYWISGSIGYFIPSILTLIFVALEIQAMRRKGRKLLNIVIAALLVFCICGCNEIHCIFLLEILALVVIFNFHDRNILKFVLPVLTFVVISSLLVILAPGNYARINNFSKGFNILYGFKESVISVIKLFGIHFKSPAFITITILSLPILSAIANKRDKPLIKMNPWLACLLFILIFVSLFFPVSYSTGLPSPMRIYNSAALLFIMLWYYLLYLFIYYYNITLRVPKFFQALLVGATLIFFITGFNKEPGKEIYFTGNISRAFYDLAFNAGKYNNELNSRYSIINTHKAKGELNITVPELTVKPASIFFIDILPDSTSWINIGTAQYFGISSIKTKGHI